MKYHLAATNGGGTPEARHRRAPVTGHVAADRHGVRPATSAAVLAMPVTAGVWAPDAADSRRARERGAGARGGAAGPV